MNLLFCQQSLCLRNTKQNGCNDHGDDRFGKHVRAIVEQGIEHGTVDKRLAKCYELLEICPKDDAREEVDDKSCHTYHGDTAYVAYRSFFGEYTSQTEYSVSKDVVKEQGRNEHHGGQSPGKDLALQDLKPGKAECGPESPFWSVLDGDKTDGEHGS